MTSILENYGWILVLLIFVAPLVALWWVVRRVRRWWHARQQSRIAPAEQAAESSAAAPSEEATAGGYSFPLGMPLVVYPLLLVAIVQGAGKWWGYAAHAVYLILIAAFLWLAFSRAQFEKIRAHDPSLTRATWLLNWLLFFVVLPLAAWLLLGLPTVLR